MDRLPVTVHPGAPGTRPGEPPAALAVHAIGFLRRDSMQADFILELPNDLRAIERAVDYLVVRCHEVGFECDQMRLKLRVGVTEALANAMLYGNGRDPRKRVLVEAHLSTNAVTIRVTDEGRGFDPNALPDPTLPPNRTRPGGRGIFLIRKLMDRVEFNEQGNSITMVLHGATSPVDGRRWEL